MMRHIMVALAASFVVGCSSRGPDVRPIVHVDAEFSPVEVAAIEEGLAKWTAAMPVFRASYVMGEDRTALLEEARTREGIGEWYVVRAPSGHGCPATANWQIPDGAAAFTHDEHMTSVICLDTAQMAGSAVYLANAVAHEAGHALGLDHYAGPPSIMRVDTERETPWTVQPGDVARVRAER